MSGTVPGTSVPWSAVHEAASATGAEVSVRVSTETATEVATRIAAGAGSAASLAQAASVQAVGARASAVAAQQQAETSKGAAVAAAGTAQAALSQVSAMIIGATALGTQLSAADGFNNSAIGTGKPFFVADGGNAVLYVKGATLAETVPSTNPALVVPGVATLTSALSAVGERLPLDGSVAMTGSLPLGGNAILDVVRIDLSELEVGDDNLINLVALRIAAGQTALTFAVNIAEGTVAIGALDDDTKARTARDLYGAGVGITTVEQDEAGIVDLFGLRTPEGRPTRSVGVNPRTGEVALGALDRDSLARLAADLPNSGRLGTAALAPTITLIPQAGQSLATGEIREASLAADEPLLLSSAPLAPNCWMFNTGLRGVLGQTLDVARIVDFVPAQDEADGSRGQVPGSAMMARLHAENCRLGVLHDMVWRGHAQGGRTIAQLSEGTAPFENGIREIERAIAIAARYGREVSLPAIMWTQGEQDRTTPEQTYFDALIALRNAYNARLLPLLPAGHPQIALVMDQVSASSYAGAGTPAQIAQYRAARDVPGFYLTGPHFQLVLSDSVHLRAKSYALLGEYQGRCWHEVFRLGKSGWRPVMPVSVVRSGTAITLTLNRPYGGNIVVDTDTLPLRTNYGFEYSGANITGVQITNAAAGVIRIDLDAAAPGTLSYAWTSVGAGYAERAGAWGNIRDDSAVRAVTLPRVALPNWCVTFQEPVA